MSKLIKRIRWKGEARAEPLRAQLGRSLALPLLPALLGPCADTI